MSSLVKTLESIKLNKNNNIFGIAFDDDLEIFFEMPSYKQAVQYASLFNLVKEDYNLFSIFCEYIFSTYVIDKQLVLSKIDTLPAGIFETLTKLILYKSGVLDGNNFKDYTEKLMEYYREDQQKYNILNVMKRRICATFPAYTIQLLDNLSYESLVETYIQCENYMVESEDPIVANMGLLNFMTEEDKPKQESISEMMQNSNKELYETESNVSTEMRHNSSLYDDPTYKAKREAILEKLRR